MERGDKYDWDQGNRDHIAAHNVEPHEVEEALANAPLHIEDQIDAISKEKRVFELGHTNAGRVLNVVWTLREGLTRVVTAYDANRKTRAGYNRIRKDTL
jgi:uncharacterized DUF497 family protein